MLRSHDKHSPNTGIMRRYASFIPHAEGPDTSGAPFSLVVNTRPHASVFTTRQITTRYMPTSRQRAPCHSGGAVDTAPSRKLIVNTQTDEHTTGCRSEDRPEQRSNINLYTPVSVGSTASGSHDRLRTSRIKSARGVDVRDPTISSKRCFDLPSMVMCVKAQASPYLQS